MIRVLTACLTASFQALVLCAAAEAWPSEEWTRATPGEAGLDEARLIQAREYALTGEGSGYITRSGNLVLAWGDARQSYDLKSSTKSFGAIALGLAIKDGKFALADKALALHPTFGVPPETNAASGWVNEITVLHLASQTAGFQKPGGYTPLLFRPGAMWDYSDSGPNWLAECLTLAYRRDLDELMFERVFTPLGIQRSDLTWRKNAYRPAEIEEIARREFGAGIHANVDAMARIGLMMLRGGRWKDEQIIPAEFAATSPRPVPRNADLSVHTNSLKEMGPNAPKHYGLLWWNNADGTLANVPRDAFWSWGLYDSMIVVIPSLDIVVARAGKSWARKPGAEHYDVLKPFFEPIVLAASATNSFPRSAFIKEVQWAAPETILRAAEGSDNWPLTCADDDALYGAYGDGHGFKPFTKEKLSLGLVRIEGLPSDFRGENIRSPSLEARGDGSKGRKASGLLCVKGVLYLWARNTGNSQLAWSSDHGRSWAWADWKFTNSFGCPTFLNFGRNYSGNEDGFIYVYSQDTEDAYTAGDRFVLARVPVDRIREGGAYEFFRAFDARHQPIWTARLEDRAGVLSRPGSCYRASVSFNSGLKRFLFVHTKPNERARDAVGKIDTRFHGGLSIYEAQHPWGPWSIVFDTERWDVGPGDSASFPTKWISPDGRTLHLVFSGDDCFSIRKLSLTLRE
jgi:CubicO group peptidase (beta-lactamase class C family)